MNKQDLVDGLNEVLCDVCDKSHPNQEQYTQGKINAYIDVLKMLGATIFHDGKNRPQGKLGDES